MILQMSFSTSNTTTWFISVDYICRGADANPEDVVPTVGFSSVETERCGFHVTVCDLGGGAKIRAIWERYYALAHGLVLVVDASATHRAPECRSTVAQVLADPRIGGKPLLV